MGDSLKLSNNPRSNPLSMTSLVTSLEELFCQSDDFCYSFEPQWLAMLFGKGSKKASPRFEFE